MGRVGIRTFFVICITVTLGLLGIWYAFLPPQSEFLMDKRWISDQENLKRIIEDNAISILYLYDEPEERSHIGGAIKTSSEPLEREDFDRTLERFKTALSGMVDPKFLDYLNKNFVQRDDRYSAALTTASFTLVKEELEPSSSPYIPATVSGSTEESITVYALSFFKDTTRWDIWVMVQEKDGEWMITEDMVDRFVPDEYL